MEKLKGKERLSSLMDRITKAIFIIIVLSQEMGSLILILYAIKEDFQIINSKVKDMNKGINTHSKDITIKVEEQEVCSLGLKTTIPTLMMDNLTNTTSSMAKVFNIIARSIEIALGQVLRTFP